ncbi:hypothetical protein RJZ56_004952 [Blastomyces dermatitidis]
MGHMERGDIEALFGRDQSVDYTQGYGHLLFSPLEMESDGVGKHKSRRISKQKTSDGQNNVGSLFLRDVGFGKVVHIRQAISVPFDETTTRAPL